MVVKNEVFSQPDVPAIAAGRVRSRIYTFPLYVSHGDEITFLSKITRLAAHGLLVAGFV